MTPDKIVLQSAGSLSVGIIAFLMFALQILLYIKKRQKPWYLWSAAISISAVIYSAGIFIEYNTSVGPINRFSGILEFAALILLIHCMYGFTFSYLHISAKQYHLWAGVFHCIVMHLLWLTNLIVSDEFSTWNFLLLESPYVEPSIGVLGPFFVLYIVSSAICGMVIWIRHRAADVKYRVAFLSGMGLWLILGIHDGLAAFGVPALQYIMEYGFLGFAFAVLWVVINSFMENEADEKYRLIAEYANECIIIAQDLKIVFGNPAFCKLIEEPLTDISALTFYEMMHPKDREFYTKVYFSLLRGEEAPDRHVMSIKRKSGDERFLEIVITSIKYRGRDAALGVMRDITEQKNEADALRATEEKLARLKKMESLGLLAGGVAHDLNNVLSGMINYPELLLMDLPEDSKLRKPLEGIKASGERAVAIVQDLLTVARGVAIQKETVNINSIVTSYLDSPELEKLRQFHPAVTIKTGLDPDLSDIEGSPIHVRKVIMNLISNAAEAIDGTGNILISTMTCLLEKPVRGYENINAGEYILLSVSDDGPGIDKEDMERIFEPFYSKKVMGRSGTGLGLSVVWNVVQDHKGYIDVVSSAEGTTFNLYFPSLKVVDARRHFAVPISEYQGNNEKILVVDDVEAQRDITCSMLSRLGYNTISASSGEAAVKFFQKNTADLVLLDMIMDPGINGRETFERIVKIRPRQKAIIVSGFAETDEVKKSIKMGAGRYLKKPFSMEEMGLAIKAELRKK
ncbi:MAG: response regulator [Deltaproteobacteria bacterium]|nr:response regulator [Deltaproteobacteria bacterium]